MTRGVLYIVWKGDIDPSPILERSIASVKKHHPELPIHVEWLPEGSTLLDKAAMADITPFDETLFLDADTVVLGRLDYAFEKAAKHGIAVAICECPWGRRYPCIAGDVVEYNAGIIFFTRAAKPFFDLWNRLAKEVDSSILFHGDGGQLQRMGLNDQASFSMAMEAQPTPPFTLPMNWNFRPLWHISWFGPIKIYHDYSSVPDALVQWSEEQEKSDTVIDFATATRAE